MPHQFYILPGDGDHNGVVNAMDWTIYGNGYYETPSFDHGDYNYDGVVSVDDFNVMSASWTHHQQSPPAAQLVLQVSTDVTNPASPNINLSWNQVTGVDGYRIWRSLDGSTFVQVADLPGAATISWPSNQSNGVYIVRAYTTAAGDSVASNKVSYFGTTLEAPTNLSHLSATTNSITLSWTDQSSDEAGFIIERLGASSPWHEVGRVGQNITQFVDTGLADDYDYGYRVIAYNAGSQSGQSSDYFTPTAAAPANVISAYHYKPDSASIEFDTVSTQFLVYYFQESMSVDGPWTFVNPSNELGGPQQHNFMTLTGLDPNNFPKYFRLEEYGGDGGQTAYSNIVAVQNEPVPHPPDATVLVSATANNITLQITDSRGFFPDYWGYHIWQSPDGQSDWRQIGNSLNIPGPFASNKHYYFAATWYNSGGDSPMSAVCDVLTGSFPEAPTLLTPTPVSSTEIDLSWLDNSTDEANFVVERAPVSTGVFTTIGTPTEAFFHDTTLSSESGPYLYRVSAKRADGTLSAYCVSSSVTPLLATPTSLSASFISPTEIDLSWVNNSSHQDSYLIEQALSANGPWKQVANTFASTQHTCIVGGPFDPLTTYYFRVRASADEETWLSAYSTAASTTTGDFPFAPSLLTATPVSDTEVDLSWQDNSDDEANFVVERAPVGGTYSPIGTPTDHAFQDTTLSAESPDYYYRVYAKRANGTTSSYSNVVTSGTVLKAPTNPAAAFVSGGEIDISWTNNSIRATNYLVDRSPNGVDQWEQVGGTPTASVQTFKDAGPFDPQTTYYYRVRATDNRVRYSAYSDNASATSADYLATPKDLAVTAVAADKISLQWTDLSDETGYVVSRSTDGLNWTDLPTINQDVVRLDDYTVTPGKEYFYEVSALRNAERSVPSPMVVASALPAAPTNLRVVPQGADELDLSWTNNDSNATAMIVQRSTDGLNFTTITNPPLTGTAATYGDSGLAAGATYFYRVLAQDSTLISAPSAISYGIVPLAIGATLPPDSPPAAYPGGEPDPDPASAPPDDKNAYSVKFITDAGSSNVYAPVSDDDEDSITGSLKLTDGWVLASSPQDALAQAVASDTLVAHRPGPPYTPSAGNFPIEFPSTAFLAAAPMVWDAKTDAYTQLFKVDSSGDGEHDDDDLTVVIGLPDFLHVATIQDNAESGELAKEDRKNPGAFLPVNNDADDYAGYVDNGKGDWQQTGAIAGENDLLPVHLLYPNEDEAQIGTFYFNIPDNVRLWSHSDRTGPIDSNTPFPDGTPATVYAEGIREGVGYLSLTWSSSARMVQNIEAVRLTTFTMTGPLNVPGAVGYKYTAAGLPAGLAHWLNPVGGSATGGVNSANETIKWDNSPEVGRAVLQINDQYQWYLEVNVVQFTLGNSGIVYGGPPSQNRPGQPLIVSDAQGNAVDARLSVTKIEGPTVNGMERGVRFMQAGFIQNGRVTQDNAVFSDGSKHIWSLQDGTYHIDYVTGVPGGTRSVAPWYDSENQLASSYGAPPIDPPQPIQNIDFEMVDKPELLGTDTMTAGSYDVTRFNIQFDFNIYFCVRTIDKQNQADEIYSPLASGSWYFNGSGLISAAGNWSPIVGLTGDGGAALLTAPAADVPVTTGTPLNDLFAARPGWKVQSP